MFSSSYMFDKWKVKLQYCNTATKELVTGCYATAATIYLCCWRIVATTSMSSMLPAAGTTSITVCAGGPWQQWCCQRHSSQWNAAPPFSTKAFQIFSARKVHIMGCCDGYLSLLLVVCAHFLIIFSAGNIPIMVMHLGCCLHDNYHLFSRSNSIFITMSFTMSGMSTKGILSMAFLIVNYTGLY